MPSDLVIPETSDDLQEFLNDQTKVAQVGRGPDDWHKFIDAYAKKFQGHDNGATDEQRREQAQQAVKEFLESNGYHKQGRVPMTPETAAPKESLGWRKADRYNPNAVGASDAEWAHPGEWLEKAFHFLTQGIKDPRLKDMSEGIIGDGGAVVPEEFRAELLRLALEAAVVRSRARVIPMGSASIRFPAIRDTSHASNVFGGISGTWKAEAADVSSTTNQPTFHQVRLDPYKLTAYTVASNELMMDSAIAFEALLMQLFPEALAYFEDDAFINGTGVGQPLGIINSDALVTVSKETGQAATTLTYENLINMFSRMLPQSVNRAVWVAHPDVLPQLAQMSLAVGTGGSAVWVTNASQSVPMSIFGRPLIFSEKAQTLGTAGDIYFVDLSQYLIGDRQAMSVARSEHVNFTTDQMVWRFIQRVDGRPWLTSALTPRNGSNTLSPFVNLATRA